MNRNLNILLYQNQPITKTVILIVIVIHSIIIIIIINRRIRQYTSAVTEMGESN